MHFAGLQAAVSEGVEDRQSVIIEFHFILMPGSHNDRQNSESPVGVASREPGSGPRGSAMPGVESGSGVDDTNPEFGRR